MCILHKRCIHISMIARFSSTHLVQPNIVSIHTRQSRLLSHVVSISAQLNIKLLAKLDTAFALQVSFISAGQQQIGGHVGFQEMCCKLMYVSETITATATTSGS